MTLAIGAIAKDGMVVAADTKIQRIRNGGRFTTENGKLFMSEGCSFVTAVAGNSIGYKVAHAIHDGWKDEWPAKAMGLADDSLNDTLGTEDNEDKRNSVAFELIIVKPKIRKMYVLESNRRINCEEYMGGKLFAGDQCNLSLFWMQRFYNKNLMIKDLKPLVAMTIIEAGILNHTSIEGITMMQFRDGKEQEPVSEAEIENYKQLSIAMDLSIKGKLFGENMKQ